ncbi:MAG: hypothetical protein QOJ96_3079 [Alphaproteobacteria bacterium]|nr:hypothetical protein [Alphaproteobacteria bacterium]
MAGVPFCYAPDLKFVMAGQSRRRRRRFAAPYVPAIHVLLLCAKKDVDARDKRGHDEDRTARDAPIDAGKSMALKPPNK